VIGGVGESETVPKSPRKSALALLEPRILLVDDQTLALADNDLAVTGASLDAGTNLHGESPSGVDRALNVSAGTSG
jgi:hypothetical protein